MPARARCARPARTCRSTWRHPPDAGVETHSATKPRRVPTSTDHAHTARCHTVCLSPLSPTHPCKGVGLAARPAPHCTRSAALHTRPCGRERPEGARPPPATLRPPATLTVGRATPAKLAARLAATGSRSRRRAAASWAPLLGSPARPARRTVRRRAGGRTGASRTASPWAAASPPRRRRASGGGSAAPPSARRSRARAHCESSRAAAAPRVGSRLGRRRGEGGAGSGTGPSRRAPAAQTRRRLRSLARAEAGFLCRAAGAEPTGGQS
mmetsp:Transcript_48470/g.160617  ORF Transcript_48470/g.160617 Transcript_48470/m.160617 type:complete len:268 (+) Transcript_48470:148-951(+)